MESQIQDPLYQVIFTFFLFHFEEPATKVINYIEVTQGAIFMKQNKRFGLIGNTEKKNWVDYEQLLRLFFSFFHGQKRIHIFF
jgi:hypothetical protein